MPEEKEVKSNGKENEDAYLSEMFFLFKEAFRDASQAISRFTGDALSMTAEGFESTDIVGLQPLLSLQDGPFVVIRVDMHSDLNGSLLLLIELNSALNISAHLLKKFGMELASEKGGNEITEWESSVLVETANIIASKISSRLSDYLHLTVSISPPAMVTDMPWPAIEETLVSYMENSMSIFLIRTRIVSDAGTGLLLFIPDNKSYARIRKSLQSGDMYGRK